MLRQLLAVTLTLGAALATPVTNPGPPGPADPKRCVPCPQAPRSESNAHPVVFASVLSLTGRCRRDGCACCAPQAHPVELALAVPHGHLLRQHPALLLGARRLLSLPEVHDPRPAPGPARRPRGAPRTGRQSFWRCAGNVTLSRPNGTVASRSQAIEDRVSTQYGLNLYDGGTWEIALALSNEFELQDVYNRQILYGSTTGRQDDIGGLKDIRGDTADFKYGAGAVAGDSLAKVSLPGIAKNPNDATETSIPGAFYYR